VKHLDLEKWQVKLKPGWDVNFKKFDKSTQEKIFKKLKQLEQPIQSIGLHSSKYQVEETGQYRIAFENNPKTRPREVHFIGNHKQYEKWYKEQ